MQIDGSFPTHVARAYGLKLVRSAENETNTSPTQPAKATGQTALAPSASNVSPTTSIRPTGAIPSVQSTEKVSQLIGGKVAGSVDFSSGPRAVSGPDAMQLYTRSADRIEAATAIQVGRQLDVKA